MEVGPLVRLYLRFFFVVSNKKPSIKDCYVYDGESLS